MVRRSNKLSLRTFSPEVREMIYAEGLQLHYDKNYLPRTPVLLAALRGDPELYEEALCIFYKINDIQVDMHNYRNLKQLRLESVKSIRNLELVLGGAGDPENNFEGPKDFGKFLTDPPCKLMHARNMRRLRIRLGTEINVLVAGLVGGYTTIYTHLRRLEVVTVGTSADKEWFRPALIGTINGIFLNARGKLTAVCTWRTGDMNEETWFWQEESGKPLELAKQSSREN